MSDARLESEIAAVLNRYPPDCRPNKIEPVSGASGFSGAQLWKLTTPRGPLVLRRWPSEHPSPDRLRFIHDVLRHLAAEGIDFVPVPIPAINGESFVEIDGHLWEIAPWLPGEACGWGFAQQTPGKFHASVGSLRESTATPIANGIASQRPSEKKLVAALTALARLHLALARHPSAVAAPAVSPGILERQRRLTELLQGGLERITNAARPEIWPELTPLAREILKLFPLAAPLVQQELAAAAVLAVPLQPCLRDIWHEHVLFDGDRVTGIIDFGALRVESVAADLARLLGSLAGDDADHWRVGLAAYQSLRRLSSAEQTLVRAYDASGTLLSGCNWLEWIYVDRIEFANRPAVLERITAIVGRLQRFVASLEGKRLTDDVGQGLP